MSAPAPRLLLVGWDSADWKIIRPLVEAGEMPVLARLLATGASGDLTTLEPQLSPMLWTSIATGKHARHHGVHGFTEVNPAGEVVPVSAASRRCKALWDILGENGLATHLVSWFATHGERLRRGCLVSNLRNSWAHTPGDEPSAWPPPPRGTYWPEDLGAHMDELRVSPADIDPDEIIRLFVPEAHRVDQEKDRRLRFLAERLSETFTVQSATCWLLQNRPDWNLCAVYFRALDEICHEFMPCHPPRMEGVTEEDFELYQHVVRAAYRLHDLLLAHLLNLAGPDAAVMLVSDHGFHSDHLRPRFTPRVPAGITVWHRPQGVFLASGPGFTPGAKITGARLLDIAPTVLTWFGLPIGADMEGRVLAEALSERPVLPTIPSWENTGQPRDHATPLDGSDRQALLEQFAALGYIEPVSADPDEAARETRRENAWNLARALIDSGHCEEALPHLETILDERPERPDYAQMLALCQLRLGLLEEAGKTMEACLHTLGGKNQSAGLMLANIALEAGDPSAALQHLRGQGGPPGLEALALLGRTHLALRNWEECAAVCRQALALDPGLHSAHVSLARCALHQGNCEEAAGHARRAIGLQFGNPRGHFLLGAALAGLEKWEDAARSLAQAVTLQPSHGLALRFLAAALEQTGHHDAAEGALHQARLGRQRSLRENGEKLARLRAGSAARAASRRAGAQAQGGAPADNGPRLSPGQDFVIVSGLPRSGTSLMMQMLRAGGLEPMSDGRRLPDEDNPEGYWEWEEIRRLPRDPFLIEKAFGKAVKVVAPLLPSLPPKHTYHIIFMIRPAPEVVASQNLMLARRGSSPKATPEHLKALLAEQSEKCLAALRTSPCVRLLEVPYPELVANPGPWAARIGAFLGPGRLPRPGAMADVVRPDLRRQRA